MLEINFEHLNILTYLLVFASGIATSCTPCVYPMLPIVVGYLGNQTGTTRERFWRTVVYVLGMSCVYAVLGVVAALSGRFFGELTNNMYVYLVFGIFVLILAGNMLDWYSLPLPQFLQGKAAGQSKKLSLVSAFVVGSSAGLVASPCTAPVLGTVLAYVASTHNVIQGALLMLVFSLGMNVVLLILGFSAGAARNLPRSGVWMVRMKVAMGLLLIFGGLYFIFKAGQVS